MLIANWKWKKAEGLVAAFASGRIRPTKGGVRMRLDRDQSLGFLQQSEGLAPRLITSHNICNADFTREPLHPSREKKALLIRDGLLGRRIGGFLFLGLFLGHRDMLQAGLPDHFSSQVDDCTVIELLEGDMGVAALERFGP